MRHGTYIGAVTALQGKTALLRIGEHYDRLLAQFDEPDLQFGGQRLGVGWHTFSKSSFKLDPEENSDG